MFFRFFVDEILTVQAVARDLVFTQPSEELRESGLVSANNRM